MEIIESQEDVLLKKHKTASTEDFWAKRVFFDKYIYL